MQRNIGAPNRRIPPDVQPKGSTSRDLEREERRENDEPEPISPEEASSEK